MIFLAAGCSIIGWPAKLEGCKIQTYINGQLPGYLKARYDSQQLTRLAVIPFDVPETFAPPGNESMYFGREIARRIQGHLYKTGELRIIELFNQDRWPGKREEFMTGNHHAIQLAADAGYDLVLVGYLEELRGDQELNIYTKVIDTNGGVTIWSARTTVYSYQRPVQQVLAQTRIFKDRPDIFPYHEQIEEFAVCTVDSIMKGKPVPR